MHSVRCPQLNSILVVHSAGTFSSPDAPSLLEFFESRRISIDATCSTLFVENPPARAMYVQPTRL